MSSYLRTSFIYTVFCWRAVEDCLVTPFPNLRVSEGQLNDGVQLVRIQVTDAGVPCHKDTSG